MRKEEFFKMNLGKYIVTDGLYKYVLDILLTEDNNRCHKIKEYGSLSYSPHIIMFEYISTDDGYNEKCLNAMSRVGRLMIHSTDTFDILSKLSICDG